MKKTTTQQLAEAREGMQQMIAAGFSPRTRERQERLITNLKAQLANHTA